MRLRGLLGAAALAATALLFAAYSAFAPALLATPIYNAATRQRMTSVPVQLGLLSPSVQGYACAGSYLPAQRNPSSPSLLPGINGGYIGMGFWQLWMTCVDPQVVDEHLPHGTIRAGMVWVIEWPASRDRIATQNMTGVRRVSLGGRHAVVGSMDFGGYEMRAISFLGGRTTYRSLGRRAAGWVLVQVTGRAVPLRVLRTFAEAMQALRP